MVAHGLAPLFVAPDKSPKMVKIEIVGKRLIQELRKQMQQVSWRLQRDGGVICAGYQHVARIGPVSSSQVELRFNDKALDDQQLARKDVQRAWDSASAGVRVRWVPSAPEVSWRIRSLGHSAE